MCEKKTKFRIGPATIRKIRKRAKQTDTPGGGLTGFGHGTKAGTVFMRDWIALHDRHMYKFSEIHQQILAGQLDEAELNLLAWIRKWDGDD